MKNQKQNKDQKQSNQSNQSNNQSDDSQKPKPDQIKVLQSQLKTAQLRTEEYLEKYKRIAADFENYKKRANLEASTMKKMMSAPFIERLMPFYDAMDIAKKNIPEKISDNPWVKGVNDLVNTFKNILKDFNVEIIDPKKGDDFDPNMHEALLSQEDKNLDSDKILETMQVGFKLHNKVLRSARVKISK